MASHAGLFDSKVPSRGGNVVPCYSLCPPSVPLLSPVASGIIDGDTLGTVRTPWCATYPTPSVSLFGLLLVMPTPLLE